MFLNPKIHVLLLQIYILISVLYLPAIWLKLSPKYHRNRHIVKGQTVSICKNSTKHNWTLTSYHTDCLVLASLVISPCTLVKYYMKSMSYATCYQVWNAVPISVPLWCKSLPKHHRKCFNVSIASSICCAYGSINMT